jgi:hypothetical protein
MISCSVEHDIMLHNKRQRSVQQTTMPTAIDKLIDEIMASDDDLDDEDDGESVASDEAAALSKLSSAPAAGDVHELIAELMNINDDDDESVASDGEYCDCLEEEFSYIDEDERDDSERVVLHSPSSADEAAASGDSAENNDNASSRPTDDEAYDDEDDGGVGVRGGRGVATMSARPPRGVLDIQSLTRTSATIPTTVMQWRTMPRRFQTTRRITALTGRSGSAVLTMVSARISRAASGV